jgi:hypothetical protein
MDGAHGEAVDAEFDGLTVVIEHFERKLIEFQSELERLEREHQLVTWTAGYIVKLLGSPPVSKCCCCTGY